MVKIRLLMILLISQTVFANDIDNLKYEIDFDKSMDFSKKVASGNNITLNDFLKSGDLKRNQLAKSYFDRNRIKQADPRLVLDKKCEKRTTFDDYRLETNIRYGVVMKQPVDPGGQYLPLIVCKNW
ncbi:hypothetical protein [Acinetobacter stercoris]|uniref:Uncharacterized protein n=1 Tax=Acinetobacter stercoris TaxID=2126983 RepID=A0A2U3MWU3_9GAMM|nr:hypothetical protein [Acinetobacter stercoris]SPL69902.1 hypothetical protein KPC_1080 [Acinetobacter stercoris]